MERLGQRTDEVAEAMRNYVDSFDGRVSNRAEDMAAVLDPSIERPLIRPLRKPNEMSARGASLVSLMSSRPAF